MSVSLYSTSSSAKYLRERLESQGLKSGLKIRAAQALGVHTTYISQLISGKAALSLDQAEKISRFFGHNGEEAEFLVCFLIWERATDPALKKRYAEKLEIQRRQSVNIKAALGDKHEVEMRAREMYYSSELYTLAYVLASIPRFQSRRQIAEQLGVPARTADRIIDELLELKILKEVRGRIIAGPTHIHLGNESSQIVRHHTNWRLSTVQHLARRGSDDLHYSLAFSCSQEDARRIRESLIKHLRSLEKTIINSKEESAFVYCFDFFEWT